MWIRIYDLCDTFFRLRRTKLIVMIDKIARLKTIHWLLWPTKIGDSHTTSSLYHQVPALYWLKVVPPGKTRKHDTKPEEWVYYGVMMWNAMLLMKQQRFSDFWISEFLTSCKQCFFFDSFSVEKTVESVDSFPVESEIRKKKYAQNGQNLTS